MSVRKNVELKPIDLVAILYFCGLGIIILVVPLTAGSNDFPIFLAFCYIVSCIHFLIGYGLLIRKKWGYKLTVFYFTYFIKPGYPLGTLFANKVLNYLKNHDIDRDFE